ncbi:MAG: TerD family protein [Myxococcota bacterium]
MITLKKNQTLNLGHSSQASHSRVSFGLGWGKKELLTPVHSGGTMGFGGIWSMERKEHPVDLDASCLLYAPSGTLTEVINFGNLKSACGSISHSGDDQCGGGAKENPNELIFIALDALPKSIHTIILTVSSYSGDTFEGIPHAYCNVFDRDSNIELARFNLQVRARDSKGFIIASITRVGDHWNFKTIGEPLGGRQRTLSDLLPFATSHVGEHHP